MADDEEMKDAAPAEKPAPADDAAAAAAEKPAAAADGAEAKDGDGGTDRPEASATAAAGDADAEDDAKAASPKEPPPAAAKDGKAKAASPKEPPAAAKDGKAKAKAASPKESPAAAKDPPKDAAAAAAAAPQAAEPKAGDKRPAPSPAVVAPIAPKPAAPFVAARRAVGGPPKKARTAYFIFADEKRPEVQAQHPGEGVATLARATGQLWSALPGDAREKYQKQAADEKERVAKLLEEYELANPGAAEDAAAASAAAAAGQDAVHSLQFPLGRIRKICRLDPEVRGIAKEASLLVARAAELFADRLGKEVESVAWLSNRRKLTSEDVAEVCSTKERFLFLREDMGDLIREQKKMNAAARAARSAATQAANHAAAGEDGKLTSYFGASAGAAK